MKKIVLIGFLSGLCLNLFSQVELLDPIEETKKKYDNAKTTDEKLDVIFDDILEKQISDYKEMEKIKGKKSKDFCDILGFVREDEIIHKDNMVTSR